LRESFKRVHQKHKTTEYAFSIQDLDVLAEIDAGLTVSEILRKYDSAIKAFRVTRKKTLHLYGDVREALEKLRSEGRKIIEERRLSGKATFPYISTYLSYRELPMVKKIYARLKTKPDVLMIDGNGILHPRRIGIASHVGLELDVPTMGIAKRLLLGRLGKVPKKMGDFGSIIQEESVIGMALKTSKSDNYVYISPGHKISMRSSLELAKKLCFHRIPEPIRRAHRMATELRKTRTK